MRTFSLSFFGGTRVAFAPVVGPACCDAVLLQAIAFRKRCRCLIYARLFADVCLHVCSSLPDTLCIMAKSWLHWVGRAIGCEGIPSDWADRMLTFALVLSSLPVVDHLESESVVAARIIASHYREDVSTQVGHIQMLLLNRQSMLLNGH